MILANAELTTTDIRLTTDLTTAAGTIGDRGGLIVQVTDKDGTIGRGETAPLPGSAERLDSVASELLEWLAARKGSPVDKAMKALDSLSPTSRFAAHTALLDLQSTNAGLPMAQFLRSGASGSVSVNALVADESPKGVFQQCQQAVADGFRAVKLKVAAVDTTSDATRIIAASEACGPHVALRLDANHGWTLDEALHVIGRVGHHRIDYIEDPVADHALFTRFTQESGVAAAVDVPADWAGSVVANAEKLQVPVLVIKPVAVGGVDRVLSAAVSLAQDARVIVSSSIDGETALRAAVHVAAALPVKEHHGLSTGPLVHGVPTDLHPANGAIALGE